MSNSLILRTATPDDLQMVKDLEEAGIKVVKVLRARVPMSEGYHDMSIQEAYQKYVQPRINIEPKG